MVLQDDALCRIGLEETPQSEELHREEYYNCIDHSGHEHVIRRRENPGRKGQGQRTAIPFSTGATYGLRDLQYQRQSYNNAR